MKMIVFDDFGIRIFKNNEKYFIGFDEGEIAVKFVEYEINETEMRKAQLSEQDAYEVILKCQNRLNQRD